MATVLFAAYVRSGYIPDTNLDDGTKIYNPLIDNQYN